MLPRFKTIDAARGFAEFAMEGEIAHRPVGGVEASKGISRALQS
jgi:hypothetical protein